MLNSTGPFVLATFKNGKALGDGLRLLTSLDSRRWTPLQGEPVVLPLIETGGLVFRDPSMLWWRGAFHIAWTSDLCVGQLPGKWKCKGLRGKTRPAPRFGYATSTDLATWRGVRLVEMPIKDACSLWAPELSAVPDDEGGGLMVSFTATVVAGECPPNFKSTRHRAYYATSTDARKWSKPLPMLDGELEGVIDLFPLLARTPAAAADGGANPERRHVLLYKAEHNGCARREWTVGEPPRAANGTCTLVLRQATAPTARGPWRPDVAASGGFFPGGAISRPCVEGAAALRLAPRSYLVLYDAYRTDCTLRAPPPCDALAGAPPRRCGMGLVATGEAAGGAGGASCSFEPNRRGFGGIESADLRTWSDVSETIEAPVDYKHGTAVALGPEARGAACTPRPGAPTSSIGAAIMRSELCVGRHVVRRGG